jgi:nicotinamidase/pyrazinamidase
MGEEKRTALIVIDLQNDFLPGGSLAVKEGDQVIGVINDLLKRPFDLKIATKDWHPADHGSFAVNQGKSPGEKVLLNGLEQILWPVHCVQNSFGSQFSTELDTSHFDAIIVKGTDKTIDSYSGFFDNGHLKSTGLDRYLKERRITDLYFAGLATDYCVKYSVFDAIALGYRTHLYVAGCRGVNLQKNDAEEALQAMIQAGCELVY